MTRPFASTLKAEQTVKQSIFGGQKMLPPD